MTLGEYFTDILASTRNAQAIYRMTATGCFILKVGGPCMTVKW